ncbi:hypothetical protein TIFTF001_016088 [Ficus carica]|uniref:Uncharacterized protein n=1 Tax=Ficus carica TaxID=3494 RepID=A0AA88DIS2_FICCA|nr:hypothetical protein TIFTF001_016088 [Ficus carica]
MQDPGLRRRRRMQTRRTTSSVSRDGEIVSVDAIATFGLTPRAISRCNTSRCELYCTLGHVASGGWTSRSSWMRDSFSLDQERGCMIALWALEQSIRLCLVWLCWSAEDAHLLGCITRA